MCAGAQAAATEPPPAGGVDEEAKETGLSTVQAAGSRFKDRGAGSFLLPWWSIKTNRRSGIMQT